MRRIAWVLLLAFTFTIPWEYSLVFPDPFGNIARIAGIAVLATAIPGVLQSGRLRTPSPLLWLVLALFLWFCCSLFWTIEPSETLAHIRGYVQEMMIVWCVWELAESPDDFRGLLRAYVAGCWILALLTIANFISPAANQVRFVPEGQDPNDVARFLDLALPMAALLIVCETRAVARLLAWAFMPIGLIAVTLTASRGGFVAAIAALAGCGILLRRNYARAVWTAALAIPAFAVGLALPSETLGRLATIPQQLAGGDLNQRWSIWAAGWQAFVHSPFIGSGTGSFVSAAGLAPVDTAHNTAIALLVEGGIVALFLASLILAAAAFSVFRIQGVVRVGLATALVVWLLSSLVASVQENRTTWLLFGLIALAGRLASESSDKQPAQSQAKVPHPSGVLCRTGGNPQWLARPAFGNSAQEESAPSHS
ncbi:MAG TPA: O-antigen ligase family protein [Terracidiphilus sp.]|nr:O-antigen ligase family protein [Terracidiphilus sp.]